MLGISVYNKMTLHVYDFSEVLKKRPGNVRNFAAGLSFFKLLTIFLELSSHQVW